MRFSIPKLNDADPASAATFNKPLDVIENHLNSLGSKFNSIVAGSSIIVKTVPVSEDSFEGSLVYFDPDRGEFRPAIAAVRGDTIRRGSLMSSPTAMVVGMVINISESSRIADILIQGKHASAACVANCLIEGQPGYYYLSDTYPGKASTAYSVLAQPILTYVGGDEFILNITHQMPYQYTGNVLRGVISGSELIHTSVDEDGILVVGSNEWKDSGEFISPFAISDITGVYYKKTPVITHVIGTGNIQASINGKGEVTIGDMTSYGGRIQAFEYNLNGARRASDDIYTYIVFPSGRDSSVTFSTHVACTGKVKASVWLHSAKNTIDSTIKVSMYVVYDPEYGESSEMPGTPTGTTSIPIESDPSAMAIAVSNDTLELNKSCYVFVTLRAEDPSSDIRILDAGLTISPVDQAYTGDREYDSNCLTESRVAADTIYKDNVVGIDNSGKLVVASCDNLNITVVGIATMDARKGSMCEYTTYGTHNTSSQVTTGRSYFVGLNGDIINTAPDSPSYIQCIGVSTGINQIRVDIEDRIL